MEGGKLKAKVRQVGITLIARSSHGSPLLTPFCGSSLFTRSLLCCSGVGVERFQFGLVADRLSHGKLAALAPTNTTADLFRPECGLSVLAGFCE